MGENGRPSPPGWSPPQIHADVQQRCIVQQMHKGYRVYTEWCTRINS